MGDFGPSVNFRAESYLYIYFSFFLSNTLFSPDTYFGTDFRLSVNATGLLCNSILPVVTLCIVVLYSIFYL